MTTPRRVVVALVCGAFAVWATCSLGFWQLRRAEQKQSLQMRAAAAAKAAPARPDADALRDPAALVDRHWSFRGRWVPDHVVYLDNRPHAGQAGFFVLMGLRLEQPVAAEVVVDRGWLPRDHEQMTRIAAFETPAGVVDVVGVALRDEPRLLELGTSPERRLGTIWQNFDFDAYARASGEGPLPFVLREDAGGPHDGLARDWPDRGGDLQAQIDRHHGYAFQWFALAATFAALLVFHLFRTFRHGRAVPN